MGERELKMENKNELLCAYSALLLSDGGKDVTADNINAVCKAAGASVPAYYAQLFEKVNEMRPVSKIIKDAAKVGGAPAAAGAPAAGAAAPAAAAAKEESEEEDDGGMAGGGLFDEGGDDY